MPTYVYKGLESGEYFEVEQSIHDDPLTHHPETGEPVKRVIQPVGVIFKGSGWYVKDSRSQNSAGKPGNQEKSKSKTTESASAAD
ncbi:FmdB family zinc ribbon protein [Oceanithermus sp.]|jgi:putative FmdB family regulatory protein